MNFEALWNTYNVNIDMDFKKWIREIGFRKTTNCMKSDTEV